MAQQQNTKQNKQKKKHKVHKSYWLYWVLLKKYVIREQYKRVT